MSVRVRVPYGHAEHLNHLVGQSGWVRPDSLADGHRGGTMQLGAFVEWSAEGGWVEVEFSSPYNLAAALELAVLRYAANPPRREPHEDEGEPLFAREIRDIEVIGPMVLS